MGELKSLVKDLMERIDGQNREFTNITERITKNINDNIDEKFLRYEQNYRELEEK